METIRNYNAPSPLFLGVAYSFVIGILAIAGQVFAPVGHFLSKPEAMKPKLGMILCHYVVPAEGCDERKSCSIIFRCE